jgi:copper(I)-binding protein
MTAPHPMEEAQMHISLRAAAAALFAVLIFAGSACAHEYKLGPIKIGHPWTRATPGGAKVAGGYLTLTNTGSEPDRLVGGSVTNAGGFEIHEMKTEGGVMRTREIAGGIEIKPGGTVKFEPGGYHLMFTQLKTPQKQGQMVRGTLKFEKAGSIDVEFKVEAIGARGEEHKGH